MPVCILRAGGRSSPLPPLNHSWLCSAVDHTVPDLPPPIYVCTLTVGTLSLVNASHLNRPPQTAITNTHPSTHSFSFIVSLLLLHPPVSFATSVTASIASIKHVWITPHYGCFSLFTAFIFIFMRIRDRDYLSGRFPESTSSLFYRFVSPDRSCLH